MELAREYRVKAAHSLPGDVGACENLHGHNYKIQFFLTGELREPLGWSDDPDTDSTIVNFETMENVLYQKIIKPMNRTNLNDYFLNKVQTMSENIALWCLAKSIHELSHVDFSVTRVKVLETDDLWVTVEETDLTDEIMERFYDLNQKIDDK